MSRRTSPTDFRRANGAPLVRSLDGKKWERYARPSGLGTRSGRRVRPQPSGSCTVLSRGLPPPRPSPRRSLPTSVRRRESTSGCEKAIQIGRGEEAADLGTALHAMAHRLETEPGFELRSRTPRIWLRISWRSIRLGWSRLIARSTSVPTCGGRLGPPTASTGRRRELRLPDGSVAARARRSSVISRLARQLDYSLPGYSHPAGDLRRRLFLRRRHR